MAGDGTAATDQPDRFAEPDPAESDEEEVDYDALCGEQSDDEEEDAAEDVDEAAALQRMMVMQRVMRSGRVVPPSRMPD